MSGPAFAPHVAEPAPGSLWRHHSGRMYVVLLLANGTDRPTDYPRTVVYQGGNGKVWARPAADWHRSMTYAGVSGAPDVTPTRHDIPVDVGEGTYRVTPGPTGAAIRVCQMRRHSAGWMVRWRLSDGPPVASDVAEAIAKARDLFYGRDPA